VHKEDSLSDRPDEKAVEREIDLFFGYPGKRKSLSFNGGEPLLEWDFVRKTCEYAGRQARKKGIALEGVIVTNGTLLRQEHVDFLVRNGISIRISIDGDKKTHDKSRPFSAKGGKSSFDAIMRNIATLRFGSSRPSASLVFGPGTVGTWVENVEFLRRKGFGRIDSYPEIYATWDRESLGRLKIEAKRMERYYVSLFEGDKRGPFKTSMIDLILNGPDVGRQEHCGKIQADSFGTFYACDKVFSLPKGLRERYAVGNVKTGVDMEKRQEILDASREGFQAESSLGCASCPLRKDCFCSVGQYIHMKHAPVADPAFWESFCAVSAILIAMNLNIVKKLEYDGSFVRLNRF